jgi:hypothetical protein
MQQEAMQENEWCPNSREGCPDDGEKLVVSGRHRKRSSFWYYFIGIGIGFIPLILFLISISGFFSDGSISNYYLLFLAFSTTLLLSIALFIASIICLCIERVCFVGYGLLTMVVVAPAILFLGCIVFILVSH